jgi:hypothetical protein
MTPKNGIFQIPNSGARGDALMGGDWGAWTLTALDLADYDITTGGDGSVTRIIPSARSH